MKRIKIDGIDIGDGCAPYVVAEISANHNGDIEAAKRLIESAKLSGAHAVKMQTYTPDTITLNSDKPDFRINEGLWKGQTLYDLYKEAHTPYEWHAPLFQYARDVGITCFSTPFDETAVDLLEDLGAPAYKIASFEAIDLPLIEYVARTKKPMVISTGMANEDEIREAVATAKAAGCEQLILLHCISAYPAPISQSNLLTIPDMARQFGCAVGLSDHTEGTLVSSAAVALGACFIEKHFIMDRSLGGPDSSFSIEPDELVRLCEDARNTWLSLGKASYERKEAEKQNLKFRRSIYVTQDLKKGDILTEQNIRRVRPGFGLPPRYYKEILGKTLLRDVGANEPLNKDMIFEFKE